MLLFEYFMFGGAGRWGLGFVIPINLILWGHPWTMQKRGGGVGGFLIIFNTICMWLCVTNREEDLKMTKSSHLNLWKLPYEPIKIPIQPDSTYFSHSKDQIHHHLSNKLFIIKIVKKIKIPTIHTKSLPFPLVAAACLLGFYGKCYHSFWRFHQIDNRAFCLKWNKKKTVILFISFM